MVKSISYSDQEIITNILALHCEGGIELDATFSKGNFYKGIDKPKYKYDLILQCEDVVQADCRSLPHENNSIGTIMFDPPFLATTGPSLKSTTGNVINKRFGVYPNEQALHKFYEDSLIEFYRILKDNGILIFKCQDKVSSGKQYFSHVWICNKAIELGYYPVDLFVLLAKNRIVADWQLKNQKNARKFHSYFWVFKKCNKQIQYA